MECRLARWLTAWKRWFAKNCLSRTIPEPNPKQKPRLPWTSVALLTKTALKQEANPNSWLSVISSDAAGTNS